MTKGEGSHDKVSGNMWSVRKVTGKRTDGERSKDRVYWVLRLDTKPQGRMGHALEGGKGPSCALGSQICWFEVMVVVHLCKCSIWLILIVFEIYSLC